jgi:hypothetical protein
MRNTELESILGHYLPEILQLSTGNNKNLIITLNALLDYKKDGNFDTNADNDDTFIMNYLIDLMIPADRAEEIIPQIYSLLSRKAMWDSSYYDTDHTGHATLKELATILEQLSDEIEN